MDQIIRAEQWGVRGVRGGQNGSNSQIRAEQWGARGVRGAEMDQIPKFVLNNGGQRGQRGQNGSNSHEQ